MMSGGGWLVGGEGERDGLVSGGCGVGKVPYRNVGGRKGKGVGWGDGVMKGWSGGACGVGDGVGRGAVGLGSSGVFKVLGEVAFGAAGEFWGAGKREKTKECVRNVRVFLVAGGVNADEDEGRLRIGLTNFFCCLRVDEFNCLGRTVLSPCIRFIHYDWSLGWPELWISIFFLKGFGGTVELPY
ncbi:hypothetical protein Tco_0933405 [Tanacetum coccineum]